MNTKHHGEINLVIVKLSSGDEYLGFCPEFAIVKYADEFEGLKEDLLEAAKGYVDAVDSNKLSDELLNRYDELPDDLKEVYQLIKERVAQRPIRRKMKISKMYKNAINSGDALLVPACV